MDYKTRKRREYEKDLIFYLRIYKKVASHFQIELDYQIEFLVEVLKEY